MTNEQLATLARAWGQRLETELNQAKRMVEEGKEGAFQGLTDFLDELDRTAGELQGGIIPLAAPKRKT